MATEIVEKDSHLGVKGEFQHFVTMFNKYKYLLLELVNKNIKLRYRNSWLGIVWSFIEPLLNMVVLSVVFTGIFGRNNDYVICYPIYLFSGRLLYSFFNTSSKSAMMSFRHNASIIKKVYVPKYMYPISGIFSNFVNYAISILCYVLVWIFFKCTGISNGSALEVTPYALLFFVPMLILLVFTIGVGLILSILNVYFRDIEYIWNVFSTLLFYMVPILYPLQKITTPWIEYVIKINPLYSMLELFRQCVLYGQAMSLKLLAYALAWAFGTLFVGILIFNWKSDEIVYHL